MRKFYGILLFILIAIFAVVIFVNVVNFVTTFNGRPHKDKASTIGWLIGAWLVPVVLSVLSVYLFKIAARLIKGQSGRERTSKKSTQ